MIHPIFFAKISKQNIVYHHPDQLRDYLLTFKDGQELEVVVKKFRKNRTLNQNDYWHGVVLPLIADSIGELDPEEVCQILRKKFLSYKKHYKGKEYIFTESTANLSTMEMGMFIDKVIIFVSQEFGIIVPDARKVVVDSPVHNSPLHNFS
jgi:hypothetical protein